MDTAKERISEFEDRPTESIQTEEREKKTDKNENGKASVTCETFKCSDINVVGASEKEKRD